MSLTENSESDKLSQNAVPRLNQIYFYLTEGCNLACRHCWLAPKFDSDGSRFPTLSVQLFETAIREAKPLGLTGVKLTGGEPLLHPYFLKILEIIQRENLSVTIETNGMLCTLQIVKKIAKSPKRFVSVSLDGSNAATHDWVRGVKGSFEKAQQAVRNLVKMNILPQIIMSVMHCNAHQVVEMIDLAENLGASSVKFNVLQPMGRGEMIHRDAEVLNLGELIKLGRHVERELAQTTKLRLFFDYPLAFRSLSSIARQNGCGVCRIHNILGVIPTGNYALCGVGEHISELVFGTVGEDPLEQVWRENAILNTLRVELPSRLSGVCSRCLMKNVCLGSCIAQNYYRTGSLWAPFWFCQQAEEHGFFPDTRLAVAMG